MTVNQWLAMNFRQGTGIMHMDPTHGPLSDKSDSPSQFSGYGPASSSISDASRNSIASEA